MPRLLASAVIAAILFVLFCCPPPAFAEQQPEVMVCPITGETCETSSDCDPPPPELIAAPAPAPDVVVPDAIAAPPAPALPTPHELRPAVLHHWSAPTRTTVLRI
jgi:hypothetical protein